MPHFFRCLITLIAVTQAAMPAMGGGHATDRVVLVTGATGQTGSLVVPALRDLGLQVRGMTRNPEQLAESQPGLQYVVADVTDPATLPSVMAGANVVISTIGARFPIGSNGFKAVDWEGNRALIDAAKAAGVEHYVLLSAGSAGRDGIPYSLSISPYPWKARAEAYLRASGMTYTIVAAGGLGDAPAEQQGLVLAPRSDYETGQISRADLATLLAACVDNPAAQGKTFTAINSEAAALDAWRNSFTALPTDGG